MKQLHLLFLQIFGGALIAVAAFGSTNAAALDTLKVAVAQRGGWSTAVAELGMKQGLFQKRGVNLDILYTDGSGEAIQAVISGSVDASIALGTGQVMGAFGRGAPIRIIGGAFTGANDILWYVPSSSPLKDIRLAKGNSIAYGSTGSSTHIAALSAVKEFKLDAKLIQAGGYTSTFTQVMSGQIDIGWLAPPVGLQAEEEGKIRIIGSADQLQKFKKMTVRVIAANLNAMRSKKAAMARFIQGYRDTLDWLYTGTDGVKMFAKVMKYPEQLALRTRDSYFPKDRMSPDLVSDLKGSMADAIAFKLLTKPLSNEQLRDLVQIPAPLK